MHKLWALIQREIATDSRKPRSFVFRGVIALLLVVPVLVIFLQMQASEETGTEIFGYRLLSWISSIQFFLVLLLGPATSSGALARERENRTFDSLRVSGVGITSIALAKTIGAFLNVVDKMVLCVPAFGIASLLGASFITALLPVIPVLLGFTFLTCALGSFFGLVFRRPLSATMVSYAFTLLYFVCGLIFSPDVPRAWRSWVSPLHAIGNAVDTPGAWLEPVALYLGVGIALSLVAWPVHYLTTDSRLAGVVFRRPQKAQKNRSLGRFPVFRYALRGSIKPYLLLVGLVFAGDAAAILFTREARGGTLMQAAAVLDDRNYQSFSLGLFMMALQLLLLLRACQQISNERASKTFNVLGTTPVSGSSYLLAKFSGMLVYSLPAVFFVFVRLGLTGLTGLVGPWLILARTVGFFTCALYYVTLGICLSAWLSTALRASVVALIVYVLHTALCACCAGPLNPFWASVVTYDKTSQLSLVLTGAGIEIAMVLLASLLLIVLLVSSFDRLLGRLPNKERAPMPPPRSPAQRGASRWGPSQIPPGQPDPNQPQAGLPQPLAPPSMGPPLGPPPMQPIPPLHGAPQAGQPPFQAGPAAYPQSAAPYPFVPGSPGAMPGPLRPDLPPAEPFADPEGPPEAGGS